MSRANPIALYATHKHPEAFAEVVTQYQRLVFATCRRQLRNPADVDDAVQETFLRLAQRAAELHTNLGAWLHRCATNVSTDINRRRATRQRHEAVAAALPKPADGAQQTLAELREHLDAALQKLDADARELIVDRYFLGHAQTDLAADAGVAPSTITHRLNAAITALREQLQSVGCITLTAGGTAALVSALQAEHASATVPPALTANLMKIGLTGVGKTVGMSASLKLAMAVVALLLSGLGIWLALGQTSRAYDPIFPTTEPATVTVRSQQNGGALPPHWKPTPAGAPWGILAGRVADSAGKPIAGATIELNGPQPQSTKSDDQGNYSFRQLTNAGDYRIGVRAPGFIFIEPYLSREPALQLSPDAQARRDFILDRGLAIKVVAVDEAGLPLKKASLDITKSGDRYHRQRVQTQSRGEFTLPISKDLFVVSATMDGYAPEHVTIHTDSPDAPHDVRLTLKKGLTIPGVAICSDHKPAAGWSIFAQPDWWQSDYFPKSSLIDNDGNFTLTSVGPGQYTIWLSRGNSSRLITTMTFPPVTQPLRIDLPMPSPSSMVKVTGRIRFNGTPPNQLDVSMRSLSGDDEYLRTFAQIGPSGKGSTQLAKNEGEYTFTAPPGPYKIQFESTEIESTSLEKITLPGELPLVTLNVIGKPHLTGTATNAATAAPISHFAVRVRKWETLGQGPNYGQDHEWTQVSDAAGHFDVETVGAGVYQVQASANGYAWLWSPKVRLEPGQLTQDVQLPLTAGGTLAGTIRDPAGHPVAGAKVIPLSMARTVAMAREDRFGGDAGAVLTDAAGHFTLPHLQPGDETLKIAHPRFAPLIVKDLTVAEGKTTDVPPCSLLVGGTVEGIVRDNAGNPVAGAALQFMDDLGYGGGDEDSSGKVAAATTDPAGHYRVEHLAQQILWVNLPDRWQRTGVVRRVVRPLEGKTARLDFGGTTPVKGRLSFGGHPYANQRVELSVQSQYFGPVMVTATTDPDGNFLFVGPPPGRYTLFCHAPHRNSDWIALRDVETADQPIDLGSITVDVGELTVHLTADDPASLSNIQYVTVTLDDPKRGFQGPLAQTGPGIDPWKIGGIPAGHYKVSAHPKDARPAGIEFTATVDRKPNAPQTALTLHLPKSTATLKLTNTQTSQPKFYLTLRNQDGSVMTTLHLDQGSTATVKLPPGIYHVINRITDQPRQDLEPIVLKEDDVQDLQADFSKPDPNPATQVELRLWSQDGVLVTSPQPHLLDARKTPFDPWSITYLGTLFTIPPGQYQAVIDRPAGGTPLTQQLDLRHIAPPENGGRWVPTDIVLPQ